MANTVFCVSRQLANLVKQNDAILIVYTIYLLLGFTLHYLTLNRLHNTLSGPYQASHYSIWP